MDYLSQAGKENFSSQHCTYFALPSEFGISIHNDKNCPVLDNYDNKIVRISLNSFDLLLKGAGLSPRVLISLKYNDHIRDKKHVLKEQRNRYYGNPIKG